jgi:hypothetical protein
VIFTHAPAGEQHLLARMEAGSSLGCTAGEIDTGIIGKLRMILPLPVMASASL